MRFVAQVRTDIELAGLLGVSPNTIKTWKQRDSVPYAYVKRFAGQYSVSIDYLMEGQQPMRRLPSEQQEAMRRDEYDAQQLANPKSHHGAQENRAPYDDGSEFVSVDRYDVSASMGNGEEVFEERLQGALKFRREWLRTKGIEPSNARLLEGHGDSMEPLLYDRDLILIDKGAANNWGDGVYCVRMDGRLMMKRLQRMPGGVKIISENSTKYQPISLDLTDEHSQREFAVIGKMRWFARET